MTPQGQVNHIVTSGGGKGARDVGISSFTAFVDEVIHFVYVEIGLDGWSCTRSLARGPSSTPW